MNRDVARRDMLALASLLPLALLGCRGKDSATPAAEAPLPFSSVLECVSGAGLVHLVSVKPRTLFEASELSVPLAKLFSNERLTRFSAATGGIDIRSVKEAVVATYRDSRLVLARTVVDPTKVERAFTEAATTVDARAVDYEQPPFVRIFGTLPEGRAQLVIAGHEAVFFETGRFGPLRAAEAFALKKLKRTQPALAKDPLSRTAEVVGDGEVRAFAPGPFEGEWASGLAGLLGVSTSCGASGRLVGKSLHVTVALTGGFGDGADKAKERLAAAIGTLGFSAIGRLLGLDKTLESPRTEAFPDAVVWRASYDAPLLLEGLYAAVGANVDEMMKF